MQIVGICFFLEVKPKLEFDNGNRKGIKIGPEKDHFYFLYNNFFEIATEKNKRLKNYYNVKIIQDGNDSLNINIDLYFEEEEKEQVEKLINELKEISKKSKEEYYESKRFDKTIK